MTKLREVFFLFLPLTLSVALDVTVDFKDQSQVVFVGPDVTTVRLICAPDVDSIPFWVINEKTYYWQNVPLYYSYDIYAKALVIAIDDLPNFENNRYQCYFSRDFVSNSVILRTTDSSGDSSSGNRNQGTHVRLVSKDLLYTDSILSFVWRQQNNNEPPAGITNLTIVNCSYENSLILSGPSSTDEASFQYSSTLFKLFPFAYVRIEPEEYLSLDFRLRNVTPTTLIEEGGQVCLSTANAPNPNGSIVVRWPRTPGSSLDCSCPPDVLSCCIGTTFNVEYSETSKKICWTNLSMSNSQFFIFTETLKTLDIPRLTRLYFEGENVYIERSSSAIRCHFDIFIIIVTLLSGIFFSQNFIL